MTQVIHGFSISLIILFLHSLSWDGMIFDGIKKIINSDKKISKPIYGCPICMTPYWGTILYIVLFSEFKNLAWIDYIITVSVACGFSVVWVIFLSIKEACDRFKEDETSEKQDINIVLPRDTDIEL